jgi:hypothetical protein
VSAAWISASGAAPVVAMLGEVRGVALPRHDVAEDAQPGHAGDVADDERELKVHLDERLLHALHHGPGTLDERGAMAEQAAEGHDSVGGAEAPAQEAEDVQSPGAQSETSLFRPGRFLTWRALTRMTWKPRASRISNIGYQYTPVASIATCVMRQR